MREHTPLATTDKTEEYSCKQRAKRIFVMSVIISKEYIVYIRPLTLGQMCLIEVFLSLIFNYK